MRIPVRLEDSKDCTWDTEERDGEGFGAAVVQQVSPADVYAV